MIRIQNWFGTIDAFVEPLIERLQPTDDKTVREMYDNLNGREVGWFRASYGRENIDKFIEACDKYGFDKIITEIYLKHIKTIGRFGQYLDSKLK